jgi:FAD/FMN-containing dehydrogenase
MTFAKRAMEFGRTIAAEHGIAKLTRNLLKVMYGDGGIKEMEAAKESIDTRWMLHRANIIEVSYDR